MPSKRVGNHTPQGDSQGAHRTDNTDEHRHCLANLFRWNGLDEDCLEWWVEHPLARRKAKTDNDGNQGGICHRNDGQKEAHCKITERQELEEPHALRQPRGGEVAYRITSGNQGIPHPIPGGRNMQRDGEKINGHHAQRRRTDSLQYRKGQHHPVTFRTDHGTEPGFPRDPKPLGGPGGLSAHTVANGRKNQRRHEQRHGFQRHGAGKPTPISTDTGQNRTRHGPYQGEKPQPAEQPHKLLAVCQSVGNRRGGRQIGRVAHGLDDGKGNNR